MRKIKAIILILCMALCLASCGGGKEEPAKEPEKKGHLTFERFGLSFIYPADIFDVAAEGGDGDFIVSLTKSGEDPYSIPRIDIFSASFGSTEDGNIEEAFRSAVLELLSVYLDVSDEEFSAEFIKSGHEVSEFVSAYAKVRTTGGGVDVPLIAEVEYAGGNSGILVLGLYQEELDEESVKLISDVIAGIRFSGGKE